MGTPEFASGILQEIINKFYDVACVVTVPDKPAGRGQKLKQSAVKEVALLNNISILQPEKLRDNVFLEALSSYNADIFIVIAFRMLPKVVWSMPRKGTFNLHASLLPHYRGAAPINWAIINGEKITGVTTFFINEKIDTGDIILAKQVSIDEDDDAGSLHDKLMKAGKIAVIETLELIKKDSIVPIKQNIEFHNELKIAPKIFNNDCKIDFNNKCKSINLFIRGLSPYPAAYLSLSNNIDTIVMKVYKTSYIEDLESKKTGKIESDNKNYLKISCLNGWILIEELQIMGKKKMKTIEFLRGFRNINNYYTL